MKVIAIGGEPASGKTTLMKKIISYIKPEPQYNAVKMVPYLKKDNVYILGKYEEGVLFAGTDKMSMAVQPVAINFLSTISTNSIILFEGDRLFTESFLKDCAKKYFTKIIYLSTKNQVRTDRYNQRGSNQNKTWLAGRQSKIKNIITDPILKNNVFKFQNNTLEEQKIAFDFIIGLITPK